MKDDEIRRALKVAKLYIKLTNTLRLIVIGELKRICEENNHHWTYDWKWKKTHDKPFYTRDYAKLAKACLPHTKDFTRLEDSGDPNVFLNILSQDQLFPDVWQLACDLKNGRDDGFHGIAKPNYWTEELVDQYFQSVRELVNKFPRYIQMEVLELELEGLRQTYFDEEEVIKFIEEQKQINEEQKRERKEFKNVLDDQQLQLSSMQIANAQRESEEREEREMERGEREELRNEFSSYRKENDKRNETLENKIKDEQSKEEEDKKKVDEKIESNESNILENRENIMENRAETKSLGSRVSKIEQENKREKEKVLPSVIARYKTFLKENPSSRCKIKLEQVKDSYLPLKYQNISNPAAADQTLDISQVISRLEKSKTSLVSAPSGSGKSTTAAKIMELWYEGKIEKFEICIFLSLKTHSRISLSKMIWGQIDFIDIDIDLVFQELREKKKHVLVVIDSLDEYSLQKNDIDEAISRSSSKEVSIGELIVNILTKNILPEATVLGFSRSAVKTNKELLGGKAEIFQISKLTDEDVKAMCTTDEKEKTETFQNTILSFKTKFHINILFVKEMLGLMHREEIHDEKFSTESEFHLLLLLLNLHHNNTDDIELAFSTLPSQYQKDFLRVAEMCKSQILLNGDNPDTFEGTKYNVDSEEFWKWDIENEDEDAPDLPMISMQFIKSLGIFHITPAKPGRSPLTAHHLSFVEFMAAISFLQNDLSRLGEIENYDRFKSVVALISGLLHRNSTNSIVRNLHIFLNLKKSKLSQIRQEVYNQIKKQGIKEKENFHHQTGRITLTFDDKEVILDKQPLLETVLALNVPIDKLKSIKAERMEQINPLDFLALKILTEGSAIITYLEQRGDEPFRTFSFGDAWICQQQLDLLENGKIETFRAGTVYLDLPFREDYVSVLRNRIKEMESFKLTLSEDYLKHITAIIENTNVRDIIVESIKFSDSNIEEMKQILETSKLIQISKLKLDTGECESLKMSHTVRFTGEIDWSDPGGRPVYENLVLMEFQKICCKSTEDLIVLQKLVHGNVWKLKGGKFDFWGLDGGLHLSNMSQGDWNILTELCDSTMLRSISSVNLSFQDINQATLRQICRLWKTLPLTKHFLVDGDRFLLEDWSNMIDSTATTDIKGEINFDMVMGNMNVYHSEKDGTSDRELHFLQN